LQTSNYTNFSETVAVKRLQTYLPAQPRTAYYRRRAGKWRPPPLFDHKL